MEETNLTFEQAFNRLEEILAKMNQGELSLDDSLKLYEEADKLIQQCGGKLTAAEKRIEALVKNRNGELALDPNQKPQTTPFEL